MNQHSPALAQPDAVKEGTDYCCVEHAALDVLPAPVVVHDAERMLYANERARRYLGVAEAAGLPVADFVCDESAAASEARRHIMLDADVQIGDVPVKIRVPQRGTHLITTRAARICYGHPASPALVQVVREIDGTVLVPSVPAAPPDVPCTDSLAPQCLHEAAFELLPVPAAIVDMAKVHRMNRLYRRVLRIDTPVRDIPFEDVIHVDFAEAGEQRRHLVIELGAAVAGASAKFRGPDGTAFYAVIDAARTRHRGAAYMSVLALRITEA